MDLAQTLSAEDKAYFGDEAVAEALADPEIADIRVVEPEGETTGAADSAKGGEAKQETPADKGGEHKTVPLAALHEERERRKELQAKLEETATRQAQMEGRFNQFMTALQQRQQPPAELPKSVEEDPIAALKRHDQALAETRHVGEQQQQFQQFANVVQQHEAKFRTETPDYDTALSHLTNVRLAEYQTLGLSEADAQRAIGNDAVNIAAHALQIGKNPAEIIYALAKQRGYAGTAADPAAAAAVPAAKEADLSGEEKMAMLERGTEAAKSLSTGGGGSADLTLEALASMDDDDFSKVTDSQWRKLWGA